MSKKLGLGLGLSQLLSDIDRYSNDDKNNYEVPSLKTAFS
jgi:hypothetical protein